MGILDSRDPSRTLEVEMDGPHVMGKAFPQQQEVVALILGESGQEVRERGVDRTGQNRRWWGRGWSEVGPYGGGVV